MKEDGSPENSYFSQEEFNRICQEFSSDVIYMLDEDMIIRHVSPSVWSVLGYDPGVLVGSSFAETNQVSPEHLPLMTMDFQSIMSSRKITRQEYTFLAKDGRELEFRISGSPLLRDGKIRGAVVTAQDITSQKRSENELKKTLVNLRKSLDLTIKTISRTIDCKDPYTAGHQQRVSDLARYIATEMKLSSDAINGIRMAGILHDIGKISLPSEILSKPGRLHSAEFELIKIHPIIGFDILCTIDFPWPIAAMVLYHHERIDGSGYPYGMTGEYVILEAKIIGVADVVVALATHRPYRAAVGIDKALEEIEHNAGILYDGDVAGACLSLFRTKGFLFVP
jgi:PAS domain S-box-containing protein